MSNFYKPAKNLGQSFQQRKKKRFIWKSCSKDFQWQNTSLDADRKWFNKDMQYKHDDRFVVKTTNSFAVFEKLAGEIPSQQRNEGHQSLTKDNNRWEPVPKIPPAHAEFPGTTTHHSFFIVEHLDKQIRVFNLTKYAHLKLNKPSSYSFSPPVTPHSRRPPSDLEPPSSYIPPHHRKSTSNISPPIKP